jgi:hypothetical protein
MIASGIVKSVGLFVMQQFNVAETWMPFCAAVAFIPILIIVTPKFGAIGAALAWLLLNAGYVFIGVHFMFRKILIDQKWKWFRDDLFLPILSAGIAATFLSFIMPKNLTLIQLIIYLFFSGSLVFIASSFSSFYMRSTFFFIFQFIKKISLFTKL